MSAQTVAAVIVCSVMVLGMLGALVTLVFRTGTLNGTITSFMSRAATDRSEELAEIRTLKDMLHNHIIGHTRSSP